MNQFVQSAIEAANQGDNNKAIAFLKQVLNTDPTDVDAWMVLAAVVDDPKQKRQCLNRVLTINPSHQLAREELEEMDRLESGDSASFSIDTVPSPTSPYYMDVLSENEQGSQTSEGVRDETSSQLQDQPLTFKFPLVIQVVAYAFAAVPGCLGVFIALINLFGGILFILLAVGILAAVLFLLPTVELNGTGIRVSNAFTSNEMGWEEIAHARSRGALELINKDGKVISISKQLEGYPRIIEMLRKMRPDLFKSKRTKPETAS